MITTCEVCSGSFSEAYRGWYDRYIPRVCSSVCYSRYVTERSGTVDPRAFDSRIDVFAHSDRSFRSSYERTFAQWLSSNRMHFLYEPFVFTLSDGSRYVPDFYVAKNIFVEVKGLWTPEGKKKFLSMVKEFWEHRIVVVDKPFLTMLRKTKP